MKRFKRNRIQRAFDKGYQLGLAGRSRENCPFLTGLARIRWLDGWREGRSDWREGLSDAITCYKLSGFWPASRAHGPYWGKLRTFRPWNGQKWRHFWICRHKGL